MFENLQVFENRYEELNLKLYDPATAGDRELYAALMKEHKEIEPIVETYRAYCRCGEDLSGAKELLEESGDKELREMAQQEIREILSSVKNISDVRIEARDERFVQAHIKTDCEDIFAVSRAVFFAFSTRKTALLEMSLKKANLEDVFIELTENDGEKQPSEGRAQTAKAGESEGMSK